jgi:hypothetical protein
MDEPLVTSLRALAEQPGYATYLLDGIPSPGPDYVTLPKRMLLELIAICYEMEGRMQTARWVLEGD